jgi:hypothetical protein
VNEHNFGRQIEMSDSNYKIVVGSSIYQLENNVNEELNKEYRIVLGGPFVYGSYWGQVIVERTP